jgi:glucose/mannose-6-phosphate isomerase
MKTLVAAFTSHIRTALDIAESSKLNVTKGKIDNVLVLGMGGSGIGGSIAAQIIAKEINVPVISCKEYSVPAFVSENSLIIASSYSGNTEETLAALAEVSCRTKHIVCICSGGKIQSIAKENKFGCIVIPGGIPPRSAFGYSFPQLFKILNTYGLINWDVRQSFEGVVSLIDKESDSMKAAAMRIAEQIKNKLPIIYAETAYEGVCIRFRQQLNENAKKLAWHHVFPEMNHNELVGWREDASEKAVILLRNETDHARNKKRMELSKEIFKKYKPLILEINSKGRNILERSLYLVHLTDWISVYIAALNQTDPIEIEVINYFKSELAKD